jgi:trehalose utilization protein
VKANNEIKVTVWNEFRGERKPDWDEPRKVYPDGIHEAIAGFLRPLGYIVACATLDEPEHGLTAERLNNTDVLLWWGHAAHHEVSDEIVQRVYDRVQQGMGLILLHSSHASKIFHKLCGTNTGSLKWRESGDKEILWVIDRTHPIVDGLEKDYIILEKEETYGEPFEIPKPDELVFMGWFSGGEVFRSGVTYRRGLGKVFFFQPGHETFPIYYNPEIQKVIANAVNWCAAAPPVQGASGHVIPPFV